MVERVGDQPRGPSHDTGKYPQLDKDGYEFAQKLNREVATALVKKICFSSNEVDQEKVIEYVVGGILLDRMNVKWGGRRVILQVLKDKVLANISDIERENAQSQTY